MRAGRESSREDMQKCQQVERGGEQAGVRRTDRERKQATRWKFQPEKRADCETSILLTPYARSVFYTEPHAREVPCRSRSSSARREVSAPPESDRADLCRHAKTSGVSLSPLPNRRSPSATP